MLSAVAQAALEGDLAGKVQALANDREERPRLLTSSARGEAPDSSLGRHGKGQMKRGRTVRRPLPVSMPN
jgi:hypothetical protein